MRHFKNILRLGVKELWSLARDPIMLVLIAFCFSISIYTTATAIPETLNKASLAIVDEDDSPLSLRLRSAFYPPNFLSPELVNMAEGDIGMDKGKYIYILNIPPNFQQDVLAGRSPDIQLNVDATRMSQAFAGSGFIQQIVMDEVGEFLRGYRATEAYQVSLNMRFRFNPNLTRSWFGAMAEIINQITMLAIILTGAALIREREHGTIEHLLVMPVTPAEIMISKVLSMGLVVLLSSALSLLLVVEWLLAVPIEGAISLFLAGAALHLFAVTSMGIFLATLARSMPQFGMLLILVLIPMLMLSGGSTPRESMPEAVQKIMLLAPTTHFVELGQAILFRSAGLDIVWPSFLFLIALGSIFFYISLARFRSTITSMA